MLIFGKLVLKNHFPKSVLTKSIRDDSAQSMFFIGMDVIRKKPVVTDRNPNLEGLVDIHRCIYLPSAHEKNQNLPDYLTQVSVE